MIELKRILPECNSDTLLVELIMQRGKPAHYSGISKVVNNLISYNRSDNFIIGLVDTDKFKRDKDIPGLKEFSEIVVDKEQEQGIRILKIPNSNKYLIRIHPAFERWIWNRADESGIDPSEHGFESFEDLCKASKKNEVDENKDLKKFINAIIIANSPAIGTLREWLGKVLPQ